MKNIFDPDNVLWRFVSRLSDLFMASIFWLVCCLPVITIIPASIALYDTVARCIRGSDGSILRRFFRTFKNELGRGILLTILWAVIGWLAVTSYRILFQLAAGYNLQFLFSIVYFCTLLVPLGMLCWVVALESRFVYSFGTLLKNAAIFTLAYLPQTAAIVVLLVVAAIAVMALPSLVFLVPALAANFQSVFIEKVLIEYMPDEEA